MARLCRFNIVVFVEKLQLYVIVTVQYVITSVYYIYIYSTVIAYCWFHGQTWKKCLNVSLLVLMQRKLKRPTHLLCYYHGYNTHIHKCLYAYKHLTFYNLENAPHTL